MKNIDLYITEKLHLNKDIKINSDVDVNTSLACITDILYINLENKLYKGIIEKIEDWCKDNSIKEFIKEVQCIVPLRALKNRYYSYFYHLEKTGWLSFIKEPQKDQLNNIYELINKLDPIKELKSIPKTLNKQLFISDDKKILIYTIGDELYFYFEIKS